MHDEDGRLCNKTPRTVYNWSRNGGMYSKTYLKPPLKNRQFLFVCFVPLRPKSTAMVIAGRSVHLATLFPGQA